MSRTPIFAAVSLFALVIVPLPAYAQRDDMLAASQALQATQERAAAEAIRPGDEALSCEEMEAELIAVMSTPEMVAAMQESMINSADIEAQAEQQQSALRGSMMTNMAMGLAGQFVPGLGLLQGLMMRQQMQGMNAESQEQVIASLRNMEAMMPGLMRGQRLSELAQSKQCAFAAGQASMAP